MIARNRSSRHFIHGLLLGLLNSVWVSLEDLQKFPERDTMTSINWRLIFTLALFGLAMAVGTVSAIPSSVEPVIWLAIFVVCAFVIARYRSRRHFLYGLLLGLVNSVWVTSAHLIFFRTYSGHHPKEAAMMGSMPLPNSPRLMMALVGPVMGIVTGAIIGLLALLVGRFVRPK